MVKSDKNLSKKLAVDGQDLIRRCKILTSFLQDLGKIPNKFLNKILSYFLVKILTRFLQDLVRFVQDSYKILVRLK